MREKILLDGKSYVLETDELKALGQRVDVGERFVAEAQHLIRQGKNAGAVPRKLQAARNVLLGRVDDVEPTSPEVAQAPVNGHGAP